MIYLNNAATTFPKPRKVNDTVAAYLDTEPVHAGRVGFERQKEDTVWVCRQKLAELLGAEDPSHIVLTSGATESLNLALSGSDLTGHVVTTAIEHNSVLRPLHRLSRERGFALTVVDCDADGYVQPSAIEQAIRPQTSALVVNHCSNVTGAVLDLEAIGRVAQRHGALLAVDASQSAGVELIDVRTQAVDYLAFAGHKSLYGLPGLGGLYMRAPLSLRPLKVGGTGIRSDLTEQPFEMPIYYEAGTPNMLGVAALCAGLEFVRQTGLPAIRRRRRQHIERLATALADVPGVILYAQQAALTDAGMLCFNIQGMTPEDVGYVLENSFGILVRTGLHCAPLIHRALGSFPAGSIRVSPSCFTSSEDIDCLIAAVKSMTEVGCAS
jgi:cysteine desulfurase / selenocysteine lyase